MEEAQDKPMDGIAYFKSGKSIIVTEQADDNPLADRTVNLLAYSNRYGYAFYATQHQGLQLISSTHIDRESIHLSKSAEDDDDSPLSQQENGDNSSIIRRSYLPGCVAQWIALNADESMLALILVETTSQDSILIFYDTVRLIQSENSSPICSPMRFNRDQIGGCLTSLTWNPAIPNTLAYFDANAMVTTIEIDTNAKRANIIGRSALNEDFSSICWSPKGKQIVVATYSGDLHCFDSKMNLKNQLPSPFVDQALPPCINVVWISTNEFLLSFSDSDPDENPSDSNYFHVLLTYEKDQPVKSLVFFDLFFDVDSTEDQINAQYYFARLNETKILFTGLSNSLKINVLGSDELNRNSLDSWTFADQYRPIVKGRTQVNENRPILTGMAIGLNSTLNILEGNKKLPPAPVLFLSNSEGVLQVYYFIHKNLPSILRAVEPIKVAPAVVTQTASSNGFSFNGFATSSTTNTNHFVQPKDQPASFSSNSNSKPTGSSIFTTMTTSTAFAVQKTPTTPLQIQKLSTTNQKLLEMINNYTKRVANVVKPLPSVSDHSADVKRSMEKLNNDLKTMKTTIRNSRETIQTKKSEHMEMRTGLENARYHMRLSQKGTSHDSLRDRELDPWTQHRVTSIESRLDLLKHKFHVFFQLLRGTMHDRSLSIVAADDIENDDFMPALEISLNTDETIQQRLQKRLAELAHKVTETEKAMNDMQSKFKHLSLENSPKKSQINDIDQSKSSCYKSDARILAHLKAKHLKSPENQIPPIIQLEITPNVVSTLQSTMVSSSNAMSLTNTMTMAASSSAPPPPPSSSSSSSSSTTTTTAMPESVQNIMRLVKTSIDILSSAASPEQIRAVSDMVGTSPLATTSRTTSSRISDSPRTTTTPSNRPPTGLTMNKTSTAPVTTPIGNFQTPMKSNTSPVPTISVTPATPATQTQAVDASTKSMANRPVLSAASVISSSVGDNSIRALLSDPSRTTTAVSTPATTISELKSTTSSSFGNLGASSSTMTTSVQSTVSPTVRPVSSGSGFGTGPSFGNLTLSSNATPLSSSGFPFGGLTSGVSSASSVTSASSTSTTASSPFAVASTTTTTSVSAPFSVVPASLVSSASIPFGTRPTTTTAPSIFGMAPTLATTTSAATPFGVAPTSITSIAQTPFVSLSAVTPTTTTTASTPFSLVPTATTSSAPSPFSAAATTTANAPSIFGATPAVTSATTTPFGSSFGTTTNASSSIFGGVPATTSSTPTTSVFAGFGATTTTASSSTSIFGSPTPSTSTAPTGGFFGAANPSTSSASGTSVFGGSAFGATPISSSSPFGGSFGAGSGSSIFGGGGGGANPATTVAGSTTATSSSSAFGASAFGGTFSFKSQIPSTTPTSTASNAPLFGGSASFGSGFTGFGAATTASTGGSGFSFGGFGAANASASTGFGGFSGAATAASPQSPSTGFGGAPSGQAFGSPTAPSSSSFTSYRK